MSVITCDARRHVKAGRMLYSEQQKTADLFASYMNYIGARKRDTTLCEFEIDTNYGTLGCGAYNNMIHCRFEDTKRCEPITGQTFSGKWNFYDFDVSDTDRTGKGNRPAARDLLELFKRNLEPILLHHPHENILISCAMAVATRFDSGGFEDATEADRRVLNDLLRAYKAVAA